LAGHLTIRAAAMGFENRRPAEQELEKMKAMVRGAMVDGAFGYSSGLVYPPAPTRRPTSWSSWRR